MNNAARLLRRVADTRLKPLGLSSAHLPIITALYEHTEMSQKALTDLVGIEQPTMAGTLSRMERDGVVVRRPDPTDGRSALVSLTQETVRRLPVVGEVVESINQDALRLLSDAQRSELKRSVQLMIASLDEALGGGS